MTVMWVMIGGLGLLVVFMITSPFLSRGWQERVDGEQTEWEQQKEMVFSQLSDLEYDYYMGKISRLDYEETKADLTAKAAKVLEADQVSRESIEREVDEAMERMVQQLSNNNGREVHS